MKDDFDQYRNDWAVNPDSLPHLHDVQAKISRLRKQRKSRILLWYSAVIFFCLAVIFYVIYTDELNSVYKSISEFLLLFASVFAFRNSWRSIHHQKQEFLMNNTEFIRSVAQKEQQVSQKKMVYNLLFISTLSVSVFLYFFETLLRYSLYLWIASAVLVILNLLIWRVIKPFYEKQNTVKNQELLSLLQNNTNEKLT
jgi:magnesium-transporting ATPase (P-type)